MTSDGSKAGGGELIDGYDTADVDVDEDGTVTVAAGDVPDLRRAADRIRSDGEGDGQLRIESESGTWTITYEDGEPTGAERTDGSYTVTRPSTGETLSRSLMSLGTWTGIGGLLTVVVAVVGGLVGALVGVDVWTPTGVFGSLAVVAVGAVAFLVGLIAFLLVPGMTHGDRDATPGATVPGFDDLPSIDRHALIAVDDAKSTRNEDVYQTKHHLATFVGLYGLVAYLFVLAFVNVGWIGVLVLGVLPGLRALVGVLFANGLVAVLEASDDPRATETLDRIRSNSEYDDEPTVYEIGESTNPVYENVAMALPELDALVVPRGDLNKLRPGELEALVAHEYKHVTSHYPAVLGLLQTGTYLAPGIVLAVTGATPTPLQLWGGLLAYFLVASALFAAVSRRWERQADDFAAEQSSPLDVAFVLAKVTDVHVVDAGSQSRLAGGVAYRSHPAPHRRIERLVERATAD